jgi:hypothetical protein
MSEYQYYESQAIDRQLTDRQIRELRAISSRATISRTRFSNYYTYGDLKANPRDLLVQYFDASLSFAHWFYVELAFRFPKTAVDVRELWRYGAGQSLDVHSTGGNVVVSVAVERDDFDSEDDGQSWLSSLTAIRADIAGGDARALYFAWLLDVQSGEIDDDVVEPARPDGLGSVASHRPSTASSTSWGLTETSWQRRWTGHRKYACVRSCASSASCPLRRTNAYTGYQ